MKKILSMLLLSQMSSYSFAAVSQKKVDAVKNTATEVVAPTLATQFTKAQVDTLNEVLSLPEANRVMMAHEKYYSIKDILPFCAFDKKQAMVTRWKCLSLHVLNKKAESRAEVVKALESPEWFMKNSGLLAMESIDAKAAATYAEKLIKDKALVVRSASLQILANHLSFERRELLWNELEKDYNFRNKQSLWIRSEILGVLSAAPEKVELPKFLKALSDGDKKLHLTSIAALEKMTSLKLQDKKLPKRDQWLAWGKTNLL